MTFCALTPQRLRSLQDHTPPGSSRAPGSGAGRVRCRRLSLDQPYWDLGVRRPEHCVAASDHDGVDIEDVLLGADRLRLRSPTTRCHRTRAHNTRLVDVGMTPRIRSGRSNYREHKRCGGRRSRSQRRDRLGESVLTRLREARTERRATAPPRVGRHCRLTPPFPVRCCRVSPLVFPTRGSLRASHCACPPDMGSHQDIHSTSWRATSKLRGWCPRPLDDGAKLLVRAILVP